MIIPKRNAFFSRDFMIRPFASEPSTTIPSSRRASWIWTAEGVHLRSPLSTRVSAFETRLFRKEFILEDAARRFEAAVSADGRYVLYLNGRRIGRGPAKGDIRHQFYEVYDLTEWLRPGKNVLALRVIDYSPVKCNPPLLGAPASVMVFRGGLTFEGWFDGIPAERLVSDTSWRVQAEKSLEFGPDETVFGGFVGYFDRWHVKDAELGWNELDYDDRTWAHATVLYPAELFEERRDSTSPYGLLPAMVHPCREGAEQYFPASFLPGGEEAPAQVQTWRRGHGPLRCEAGKNFRVVLDAERLETGFPTVAFRGGANARITLTYAEALRLPAATPSAYSLRPQGDLASVATNEPDVGSLWSFDRRGAVTGFRDVILADGRACRFEPTHWRTFRYVLIEITGGDEAIELEAPAFRAWTHPIECVGGVKTSRPVDRKIWDISVRTLQLCSHETFEDCPYYEQIQYTGDSLITSRLMLYLTGKSDLTRQLLYHFAWSLTPEGITSSRYPCTMPQVIPSWSLHWISILHDYVLLTGDREIAREFLPVVDCVLNWFRRHSDAEGLPSRLPFWNCVDWTPGWKRGQPPGWDVGATCVISSQFVHALREASRLCQWCGETDKASTLQKEARWTGDFVDHRFWNEGDGCYRDAEAGSASSVLANAWAVCAGIVPGEKRRRVLERIREWSPANVSYFGMFWVFRALRELHASQWWVHLEPWEKLVDLGLTTWPEDTAFWRSMCHAWSSHPINEYIEGALGLRVETPGWTEVSFHPNLGPLEELSFRLCPPQGECKGSFVRDDGGYRFTITKPRGMRLRIISAAEALLFERDKVAISGQIVLDPKANRGKIPFSEGISV